MGFTIHKRHPLHFWVTLSILFLILIAGCQNAAAPSATAPPPVDTPESSASPTPPIVEPPTQSATEAVSSAPADTPASPQVEESPLPAEPTLPALETPAGLQTPAPAQSQTATRYVPPTPTLRPSATPKISSTPTPPTALLRILRPGPYSKINTPLKVEAGVSPGDDGLVLLDLIGEDGRTITRQRLNYSEFIGRTIGIAPEMEFKIPGVAETARLVISSEDRFGRKIALTSTELVLISIGDNQVYPPGYQYAPYILQAPVEDQIITGGVLKVSGLARPVNLSPLIFDLVDEKGIVIESAQLQVPLPGGDQSHTPFNIDIPYRISSATRVRLTIRQASNDRIPGNVALWSVPVFLQP